MRSPSVVCAFVGLSVGCANDPVKQEPPVGRIDLRAAIGATSVHPVGVAIAGNGDRFVFDATLGLYRMGADGAVAVVPMASLPNPDKPIQLPITDITSFAPGVFALTAIGDGYLLDTNAMTLKQHFCYVPEGTPVNFHQRTDAIAYDPAIGRLYAQPVTFDENDTFQGSQLAAYLGETGASAQWNDLASNVRASGMAVLPDVGLTLGQGANLTLVDVTTGHTSAFDSLERYGIHSIDGLAVDSAAHTLLVVDHVTAELVEIALADLGR